MEEKTQPDRLPYETPVLKRIELRTEEVLAAGCKTIAESSPSSFPCDANNCSVLGS